MSHSRVFEDEQKSAKKEAAAEKKAKHSKKEESNVVSTQVEKTTLGDIEELAALKEKLAGK